MKWPNPFDPLAKVIALLLSIAIMRYVVAPDAPDEMQLALALLFAIFAWM